MRLLLQWNTLPGAGKKILFVATKKTAKEIVAEKVKAVNMPYVTWKWHEWYALQTFLQYVKRLKNHLLR